MLTLLAGTWPSILPIVPPHFRKLLIPLVLIHLHCMLVVPSLRLNARQQWTAGNAAPRRLKLLGILFRVVKLKNRLCGLLITVMRRVLAPTSTRVTS